MVIFTPKYLQISSNGWGLRNARTQLRCNFSNAGNSWRGKTCRKQNRVTDLPLTRQDLRNLISSKEVRTRYDQDKINIRIYRTWEIIPDEMHFGIIAWPSTILRPDRLWRSWGPALRVWSRCSTRDCLSWVVKNRISSSLPSKQLASEPTNSLNPPPNSCLRDFGRCTSSAALSRLWADRVTSILLYLFSIAIISIATIFTQSRFLTINFIQVCLILYRKSNTYMLNGAVI